MTYTYKNFAVDASGNIQPSVAVTVRTSAGVLATITTPAGAPLVNPFTSEADGSFEFAAARGRYYFTLGVSTTQYPFTLGDPDLASDLDGLTTGAEFTSGGPVACATTANITLSGEQTIDGVLTSISRVLVKNQTAPAQNGIYVSASGAWARATDMDTAGEVAGTAVSVNGGTTQALSSWATYSAVTTLGTDAIEWRQVSSASAVSAALALKAPLASPTLTGTPAAPTAATGTNTTQLTTTAFTQQEIKANRAALAPYIVPPTTGNALLRVRALEMYRSINGVSVTLPTLVCVRECGRDLTAGGRFRLRLAEFDGTSTYTEFAREDGNGTYLAGAQSGLTWVDIEASTTALGFSVGTIIGRALVDFGANDAFGSYAASIAYSAGGVFRNLLQSGARFENDVAEVVNDTLSRSPDYRLPFADACTAVNIRKFVRSIRLYNADKSKTYAVSVCTVETFATPATRFRMTIRNITDGVDVCALTYTVSSQPGFATFVSAIDSIVKLTNLTSGIYAVIELDWTAVSDFFSYGASTVAGAGISPECVYDDADIADYLQSDHAHEVITVGASGADYTTLRGAVESLYSWLTGSTEVNGAPLCDRASYHHRIAVHMIDDADYNATLLKIPEWVELVGNGYDRTRVVRENTNADEVLTMHLCGKMRDFSVYSETAGEYCIHSDDFNRASRGGAAQNRFIRQSFKRMRLTGAGSHNGPLFGCGISAGQVILKEDVIAQHELSTATVAGFYYHNTGPTVSTPGINAGVTPARVEMSGCSSPDALGVYLQTLEPAGISTLSLHDCTFNRIDHEVASGEVAGSGAARIQWDIIGRYDGPWINNDTASDSYTLEWAPSAAPKRRVTNSTGATIPKGRFVRFTGAATVALCGANERPEAWTIAEITNGSTGNVILTKRITDDYISGATSGTGEWGITTAGTLDYSAGTKLGRTIGGIVTVY